MKRNRKHNMFGWLAAAGLLLTTACADNADLLQGGSTDGSNVVTLTVQMETQAGGTRADEKTLDPHNNHISDGKKADVLIFAVYEVTKNDDGTETYTIAKEFAKGSQVDGFSVKDDQNAIDFSDQKVTIQFVVRDETKSYRVAFWAQNKGTKAYDTSDLQEVKVNYSYKATDDGPTEDFANNDELRDAFCGVSDPFGYDDPEVKQNGESTIWLRRPLAQVNVGTVGWDYEGAAVLAPSVLYRQSYIELSGVANQYDVLTGEATGSETVKFKYYEMPAFNDVTSADWAERTGTEAGSTKLYKPFADNIEEYLKVNLYTDADNKGADGYVPYLPWEDKYLTYDSDELLGIKTEKYKYLSMCYVLAPGNGTANSTLDYVKFGFKGYEYDKEKNTIDATKDTEMTTTPTTGNPTELFKITNVPVRKNWRTNILGNNFFVVNEAVKVHIVNDYLGDYNNDETTSGNWPGFDDNTTGGETHIAELGNESKCPKETNDSYFDFSTTHEHNAKYMGKYNQQEYTKGLKIQAATTISFTTETYGTVTIVQSTSDDNTKNNTIKFDNVELTAATENVFIKEYEKTSDSNAPYSAVRIYTIVHVAPGKHTIARGSGEAGLFYLKVETEAKPGIETDDDEFGDTQKPNPDFKDMDGTYTPNNPDDDYTPEDDSTDNGN